MDIDKPVVVCVECGKPVRISWQLFCDDCYVKLKASSGDILDDRDEGKPVRSEKKSESRSSDKRVARDSEGRLYVFDRSGARYVLAGRSWRRCS